MTTRQFLGSLLPPVLVGGLLRFWNLSGQIVGGDELHALRAATTRSLDEILFRYEAPDLYMLLAAALHELATLGVTLSEAWLRLPGMAAGLLSLVVLPALVARFVGARGAALFAWVLALSPALVLYSRIARSYLPVILLGTLGSWAFFAWWTEERQGRWRRRAILPALFLIGALGAVFFHPVAVVAVAAPLGFAVVDLLIRSRQSLQEGERRETLRRQARRLVVAALGLGLGLSSWFWLSRDGLLELALTRREPLPFDLESFAGLAMIQSGATRPAVAFAFWGLALAGFLVLLRRQRRLALYLGLLYVAPVAGLILLSPVAGDQPLLFNRYSLLALPPLLLCLAVALDCWIDAVRPRLGRWAFLPVAVLLVLWLASGPLARYQFRAGSFAHQNDLVDFGCAPSRVAASRLPEVYSQLPQKGALLEGPWQSAWRFSRALHAYQDHHRREVMVISRDPAVAAAAVRLARVLPAEESHWLSSDARYLIVHLDLAGEEAGLEVAECARRAGPMPPAVRRRLAARGATLAGRLGKRWGSPDWEDAGFVVWDLERVRASAPRAVRERDDEESD